MNVSRLWILLFVISSVEVVAIVAIPLLGLATRVLLRTDDMVLIPAGEFQMGSNDSNADNDEQPVHPVSLDAFYIDKYEVTVGQYKRFLKETGYGALPVRFAMPYFDHYDIVPAIHWYRPLLDWYRALLDRFAEHLLRNQQPVVGVTWHDAMAYARWAGKRLPTEAEWEKAARGGLVGKKYPWGNVIDPNKANYNSYIGKTTPVGSYPANDYGLYDMAGNVWEWCLDAYDSDFYARSPRRNPISGGSVSNIINNFTNVKSLRVLRGGSWYDDAQSVRVATRYRTPPMSFSTGFRCARAVTP